MDFLLLIFYLVRYFKILRKSENGSKTKMDFQGRCDKMCCSFYRPHRTLSHYSRFSAHTLTLLPELSQLTSDLL